jgi:hypothetical protein
MGPKLQPLFSMQLIFKQLQRVHRKIEQLRHNSADKGSGHEEIH